MKDYLKGMPSNKILSIVSYFIAKKLAWTNEAASSSCPIQECAAAVRLHQMLSSAVGKDVSLNLAGCKVTLTPTEILINPSPTATLTVTKGDTNFWGQGIKGILLDHAISNTQSVFPMVLRCLERGVMACLKDDDAYYLTREEVKVVSDTTPQFYYHENEDAVSPSLSSFSIYPNSSIYSYTFEGGIISEVPILKEGTITDLATHYQADILRSRQKFSTISHDDTKYLLRLHTALAAEGHSFPFDGNAAALTQEATKFMQQVKDDMQDVINRRKKEIWVRSVQRYFELEQPPKGITEAKKLAKDSLTSKPRKIVAVFVSPDMKLIANALYNGPEGENQFVHEHGGISLDFPIETSIPALNRAQFEEAQRCWLEEGIPFVLRFRHTF